MSKKHAFLLSRDFQNRYNRNNKKKKNQYQTQIVKNYDAYIFDYY